MADPYPPPAGPALGGGAPATVAPPANLLIGGRRLPIGPGGLALGRADTNDIVVTDDLASRQHARVMPGEAGHYVSDLGSSNGTFVNGERLRGESRWLANGDAISIGAETLRYVTGGQETTFGQVPEMAQQRPLEGTRNVRFDGTRLAIGRDPSNELTLADPNVSRFHAEVVGGPAGVEIRDLGSRNGTRVNGHVLKRSLLEPGTEVGVGPFRLIWDGDEFLARDDRGALRLDATELSFRVGQKTILNRASLSVAPGEFVVLIGESGSGKSTLLKALAGVTTPTQGSVAVNGEPVAGRLTDFGYVPQDEIVHADLTVTEALTYAAKLRLPDDASRADVRAVIDRVLAELALEQHAKTRIGMLSGGQRKRAALAAELLGRPSLLFLDEPTTGMDPGLETKMMELFRELADNGRGVVVVTHATKNLGLADKVCVMGRGGEMAFFGAPRDALPFFDVGSFDGVYAALDRRPAAEWRAQFEAVTPGATPNGTGRMAPARPSPPATRATGRPVLAQARILTSRYAKLLLRDRRNLAILLGQVPVIGLAIIGVFHGGLFDRSGGDPFYAAQLLFLLVTTAIWLGAIDASREVVKENSVRVREAAIGVRLSAYLLSKLAVLFALVAVQTVALTVFVFLFHPPHGVALVGMLVMLVLTSFVAVGMGLLVSATVSSQDQASSFIPLLLIPQIVFAGAIVPAVKMSAVVKYGSLLVFAQWSFAGSGSLSDLNGRSGTGLPITQTFGPDFFDHPPALSLLVLLIFLALFLAGTVRALRRRAV